MFLELLKNINDVSKSCSFFDASNQIVTFINKCDGFVDILQQIGTIPEELKHSSTKEKLFSKASDAALARAFREIGLEASVVNERGDSADVLAESKYHDYTLVADAKSFRLSRTAKNQKDFKVSALSTWKKGRNFAVLCAPYFQYPRTQSQIYSQAMKENVCLFVGSIFLF